MGATKLKLVVTEHYRCPCGHNSTIATVQHYLFFVLYILLIETAVLEKLAGIFE